MHHNTFKSNFDLGGIHQHPTHGKQWSLEMPLFGPFGQLLQHMQSPVGSPHVASWQKNLSSNIAIYTHIINPKCKDYNKEFEVTILVLTSHLEVWLLVKTVSKRQLRNSTCFLQQEKGHSQLCELHSRPSTWCLTCKSLLPLQLYKNAILWS